MRVRNAAATLTLVTAAALMMSLPLASADSREIGCSNSGYSGLVRVTYTPGPGHGLSGATITNRQYKLLPADAASDQNDISYQDNGTAPATTYFTGSAIRDGVLRTLTGTDYSRGSATISAGFNFDIVGAPDKQCSNSIS